DARAGRAAAVEMGRAAVVVTGATADARLEALEARIAVLERRVHALDDRRRARDGAHQAALEALARSTRGLVFSAQSAITVAQTIDAELDAALRAAALETPRALGRWLAMVARRPLRGARVYRVKKESIGALWLVRRE